MANPRTFKIVFGVLVLFGVFFTLIALFTPGWRKYHNGGDEPHFGLITYNCGSNQNQVNPTDCSRWWKSRQPWEKAVIACMFFALIFGIVCLVWAAISCTNFCCPDLYAPLPLLALASALLLLAAFVTFASKNPDDVQYLPSQMGQLNANNSVGYSFWLTVVAFIFMLAAAVVGFVAHHHHRTDPRFQRTA